MSFKSYFEKLPQADQRGQISDYAFHSEIILRSPVFSYDDYSQLTLRRLLNDDFFRTAIYLSSEPLYYELKKKEFNYDRLFPKEISSLKKYFNRMCFRPTPFGIFSGFSVINWGDNPEQILIGNKKVHIQFSQAVSNCLADSILTEELAPYITYRLNSSIYCLKSEYRYLRCEKNNISGNFDYFIDSFRNTPAIKLLLNFCRKERTRREITGFLSSQLTVPEPDAENFFREVAGLQIIQPVLGNNITGKDYLQKIMDKCLDLNLNTDRIRQLRAVMDRLHNPDEKLVNGTELIHIKDQFCVPRTAMNGRSDTFYANLEIAHVSGSLNLKYQEHIIKALHCLSFLTTPGVPEGLNRFIAAFNKKFEGRKVPLMLALDPEIGVGYNDLEARYHASGILEGLSFDPSKDAIPPFYWTEAHALLMEKWRGLSNTNGLNAIQITEEDMNRLTGKIEPSVLPSSIAVMFRTIGSQVYIEQAGGTSALALPGRFTAFSPQIYSVCKEIADKESRANPAVIFAELAHICNDHTANIDRRAAIREYEIPVNVQSAVDLEYEINLEDMSVFISRGNKIILWSEKHQKEIIPRLSSAFNYTRSGLAVFRFLCDLQYQGLHTRFTLGLETFFPYLSFYPRIQYGESVLHLATWHIKEDELKLIFKGSDVHGQISRLKKLSEECQWPDYVAVTRHDHQLVFNTRSYEDIGFLAETIRKERSVIIQEFPFINEGSVPDNRTKPHIHQFIAFLSHQREIYPGSRANGNIRDRKLINGRNGRAKEKDRKFFPGSKWLYFKIYCHPLRANELLCTHVFPMVQRLLKDKKAAKWFYLWYRDPEYHLRLRIYTRSEYLGDVITLIKDSMQAFTRDGMVHDFQVATYVRELERYGPDLIERIEDVFCSGSELLSAYARRLYLYDRQDDYYDMAFLNTEELLDIFRISDHDRIGLFNNLYLSLLSEFGKTEPEMKDMLNKQYHALYKKMPLSSNKSRPEFYMSYRIFKRDQLFAHAVKKLKEEASGIPVSRKIQLIADMIHLQLNRLLTDDTRRQELVIYYSLFKYYKAKIKRGNTRILIPPLSLKEV